MFDYEDCLYWNLDRNHKERHIAQVGIWERHLEVIEGSVISQWAEQDRKTVLKMIPVKIVVYSENVRYNDDGRKTLRTHTPITQVLFHFI